MKVSVNIVVYNGIKYLESCFKSLNTQTFRDFEIIVIDNNSSDGSYDFIKNNYPNITLIKNNENVGFAKAHNQAINQNKSEYVLVTNQDIILENDFLEKLVYFLDNNKDYGSCGGRLMKMFAFTTSFVKTSNTKKASTNESIESADESIRLFDSNFYKTDIIDCLGLTHTRGYRFFNIGEGINKSDFPEISIDKDIFGVSGALVLYRRSDLEKVKDENGYFDERFFMYKEDIDLAWRLKNIGSKARYINNAIAYHERGFSGNNNQNIIKKINRKNNDKEFLAYLSYKNHFLMLKKNLNKINIFIIIEETKKAVYYILFKPKVFIKVIRELNK